MATKVKEKGSLKLIPIPQPQHIESVAEQQEQEESENNNNDEYWRKIPYVDIKDLGPGIYAGMKMEKLLKPWQEVQRFIYCTFLHLYMLVMNYRNTWE